MEVGSMQASVFGKFNYRDVVSVQKGPSLNQIRRALFTKTKVRLEEYPYGEKIECTITGVKFLQEGDIEKVEITGQVVTSKTSALEARCEYFGIIDPKNGSGAIQHPLPAQHLLPG